MGSPPRLCVRMSGKLRGVAFGGFSPPAGRKRLLAAFWLSGFLAFLVGAATPTAAPKRGGPKRSALWPAVARCCAGTRCGCYSGWPLAGPGRSRSTAWGGAADGFCSRGRWQTGCCGSDGWKLLIILRPALPVGVPLATSERTGLVGAAGEDGLKPRWRRLDLGFLGAPATGTSLNQQALQVTKDLSGDV